MRTIDTIIVHCSATPPGMDIGVREIRSWHVNDNGWDDIGYHHVIRRCGAVEDGRPKNKAGAHAKGHNQNSIGICLVGGVNKQGKPDANFTSGQYNTLRSLIEYLQRLYPTIHTVIGHRDVEPNKQCPCFDVQAFIRK